MDEKPVISFLVCTRNRAQTVYSCVLNLLASLRPDIEVIVRDNNSTDNTLELLSGICDLRLKVYSASENQGTLSFFEISKLASGRIVTWLSDEDDFHFEHLDFIVSNFENSACNVMFGSIVVGQAARSVTFADETITDPVRANLTGLLFSGCGGLFVRRTVLGFANSFNISGIDDAYALWNYYPVGFFASRCIERSLITTSRVLVTQSRFAHTTNNWSKLASGTNVRLPHYYPESVFERLSSNIVNIFFKSLPVTTKFILVYRLIRLFHLQAQSYSNPAVQQLLSENYPSETVRDYIDHVTRLKLDRPMGRFLWSWTRTSVLFLAVFKTLTQWRQLAAK